MKRILTHPHRKLRETCAPVTEMTEQTKRDMASLRQVLQRVQKPWMVINGIAANQIGIQKRIVWLKRLGNNYVLMLNPEIIWKHLPVFSLERCFSLPGVWEWKVRHAIISVSYQDSSMKHQSAVLLGATAFTMQQEIDHLNGKLIIDSGAFK